MMLLMIYRFKTMFVLIGIIILLIAWGFDLYFIYLLLNPPRKPSFSEEREKYFEAMDLLGYKYHQIEGYFILIPSFKDLMETNKKLRKATKQLRNDKLRSRSNVLPGQGECSSTKKE